MRLNGRASGLVLMYPIPGHSEPLWHGRTSSLLSQAGFYGSRSLVSLASAEKRGSVPSPTKLFLLLAQMFSQTRKDEGQKKKKIISEGTCEIPFEFFFLFPFFS